MQTSPLEQTPARGDQSNKSKHRPGDERLDEGDGIEFYENNDRGDALDEEEDPPVRRY